MRLIIHGKEVRSHDFRRHVRRWGHNLNHKSSDGGHTLELHGWGGDGNIERGHYLILGDAGQSAAYRVSSIRRCADPPDMWFANATYVQAGSCPKCETKFYPQRNTCPICQPQSTDSHSIGRSWWQKLGDFLFGNPY